MFEMTYSFDRILDLARPVDDTWSRAMVEVAPGESAWLPGTTKKMLMGPASLQYDISPSGVTLKHVGYESPSDIKSVVTHIPSV